MGSVRVSGSDAELRQLVGHLGELASPAFRRELNEQLEATAVHEIGSGFEAGRDPYGTPWKKTTSRDGETLLNTGRLRSSFGPYGRATPGQFGVATNVKYAGIHQYGATIVPVNGKALVFKVPVATRVFNKRTGARLKRAQVVSNWVSVQKVVIPRRQMVPEGELGPVWSKAFDADVGAAVADLMNG